MSRLTCPGSESLSRAFSEGPSSDLTNHLTTCTRCAEEWRSLESLAATARSLPWKIPSPSDTESVRASLLSSARFARATPRVGARRFFRPVAVAAGLAACVAVGIGIRGLGSRDVEANRATVQPSPGARFEHSTWFGKDRQSDEVVRLSDGRLRIEVKKLQPTERFRVVAGDAEVEVRGTAFEVTALADHLEHVQVEHGLVEVRVRGAPPVLLAGGQSWNAAVAAISALSAPPAAERILPANGESPAVLPLPEPDRAVPLRRIRTVSAVPKVSVEAPEAEAAPAEPAHQPPEASTLPKLNTGPAEQAFALGWSALRGGRAAEAAEAFHRAAGLTDSPIAEDANYWEAVSLARAGEASHAEQTLRAFIERYPHSPRAAAARAALEAYTRAALKNSN
jgi:hypothetical protein